MIPLPAGDVWLDLVNLDGLAPALSPEAVLDDRERVRAARYVRPLDRERFVRRRAALRVRLARLLGVAPAGVHYQPEPLGRLRLVPRHHGHALTFSVSSSGPLALYGFACGPDLGVDLEAVRPFPELDAVARQLLGAAEQAMLAGQPPAARPDTFFICWTNLEARLKAAGAGLAAHGRDSAFPGRAQQWNWRLIELATGQTFRASLAVLAPGHRVRWTLPEGVQIAHESRPG